MKLREFGVDLNLDFLYCKFWTEACERCEDLWKIRWHSATLCFWFRNFPLKQFVLWYLHNTLFARREYHKLKTKGECEFRVVVQMGETMFQNELKQFKMVRNWQKMIMWAWTSGKLCGFCCFLCFLCEKLKHKLFLSSI